MSYLTQMLGLTVQNFVSAASGMAVLIAVVRGFMLREANGIGNFWVDMAHSTLYVLLPLALILAVALVGQGVVQSFQPSQTVERVQPVAYEQAKQDAAGQPVLDAAGEPVMETVTATQQTIAVGPAASQVAIKQLGTNGGGFFNTNSAHPLENPTPLSNWLQMLALLLIPAALCFTFGKLVGDMRQGVAILAAMTLVLVGLGAVTVGAEQVGNPLFERLGLSTQASEMAAGGNMEGKETRFGIVNSAMWATATTAASNGSVNAMHDSFTPLGGMVPMWLMQLGEVIFGGAGSGLYGMLVFAIVAVFVAGLMIGRTPEYLGKKNRSLRDQDGRSRDSDPAAGGVVGCGRRGRGAARHRRDCQSGRARLLRNSVCVLVGRQQQRQCVRRFVGQYAVLQQHARVCDAICTLLAGDRCARDCRFAGGEEKRPGLAWHPAYAYPAVCRAADRRSHCRRRADLLARVGAGAGDRAVANDGSALDARRLNEPIWSRT